MYVCSLSAISLRKDVEQMHHPVTYISFTSLLFMFILTAEFWEEDSIFVMWQGVKNSVISVLPYIWTAKKKKRMN